MLLIFIINKMEKRNTWQKETIRKEIDKKESFFTAEDIFRDLKDNGIGIATIYRFLTEEKRRQRLHSYICNRKAVYSKEKDNHCHCICQKCGQMFHFDIDKIDFLKNKIKGSICHFQVDVTGICDRCKK